MSESAPPSARCEADAMELPDGTCLTAGIPDDACAPGFAAELGGCVPILPSEPCPAGQVALPGEETCRPLVDCGSEPWGAAPAEPTTQYVDGSYQGGNSDGSQQRPWTTIEQGVSQAAVGAVVAVAAGVYPERVLVYRSVRIWGRCPDMVRMDPPPSTTPQLTLGLYGPGIEVHNLSLSGEFGLGVAGTGARIDGVWVHDFGSGGIGFQSTTDGVVTNSLVEQGGGVGIAIEESSAYVESTVVRDVGSGLGRGIYVQSGPTGANPSELTLRGSVVERFSDAGIAVAASLADVEGSVVQQALPAPGTKTMGMGIVFATLATIPSHGSVRKSAIRGVYSAGLFGSGNLAVEHVTVNDMLPRLDDGEFGVGIAMESVDSATRAALTLSASLVERVSLYGVGMGGTDATIDGLAVRDVRAGPVDGLQVGTGVALFQPNMDTVSSGQISNTLIERIEGVGVDVSGSGAALWHVGVRELIPTESGFVSRAVNAQRDNVYVTRSTVQVADSALLGAHEVGLVVFGADAVVERSHIRDTSMRADGLYGDGIVVMSNAVPASSLQLVGSTVSGSARAGLVSFGGQVVLVDSSLRCNGLHLDGEVYFDLPFDIQDAGGNRCGCDEDEPCQVLSTSLAPPDPLESPETP